VPRSEEEPEKGAVLKILVADDDPVSRLIAEEAVRSLGHHCLSADGGELAWELFRRERPDVVISDWMMPDLDGLAFCRRIRSDGGGIYSSFILVTSLDDTQHALEGMLAGADDYLSKPLNVDELQMRLIAASRLNDLHRKLDEHQHFLEGLNDKLRMTARVDALTGLGNRLRLREDLSTLSSRTNRYGDTYCVCVLDLDRFKSFNDTYGHLEGDLALKAVADAISGQVRSEDSTYRFGGEEFVCIFRSLTVPEAAAVLERIRVAVQGLGIEHASNRPWGVVTVSAGAAAAGPVDPSRPEKLLEPADRALYLAKESGRNRVETAVS
jgi:two-component system cell cycle response regulator